MSISVLFDMSSQKIAKQAPTTCIVMSSRGARTAMEMQQMVNEESGVNVRNTKHHDVYVNSMCMFVGSIHHFSTQPFLLEQGESCFDRSRESLAGGDSLRHGVRTPESWAGGDPLRHCHSHQQEMASSPQMVRAGGDSSEQCGAIPQ